MLNARWLVCASVCGVYSRVHKIKLFFTLSCQITIMMLKMNFPFFLYDRSENAVDARRSHQPSLLLFNTNTRCNIIWRGMVWVQTNESTMFSCCFQLLFCLRYSCFHSGRRFFLFLSLSSFEHYFFFSRKQNISLVGNHWNRFDYC